MEKCINFDTCPSASGWCQNRQPSVECVQFLITHITSKPKIFYECDGRACEKRCSKGFGRCGYTTNIQHAKNFEMSPSGSFREIVCTKEE